MTIHTNTRRRVKDTLKDTLKDTVNETQRQILSLMSENPRITAKDLSSIIGINERNTKSNIKMLKELGLVERIGADKNGHWLVKKP